MSILVPILLRYLLKVRFTRYDWTKAVVMFDKVNFLKQNRADRMEIFCENSSNSADFHYHLIQYTFYLEPVSR